MRNTAYPNLPRPLLLATAAALGVMLAACNDPPPPKDATLGQKLDSAIARTERKADELGARAESATADTRASVESAAERMADHIDDATITAHVSARLAGDPELSALKIDVSTHDGKVTLSGPAPTEAARARAAELAVSVKGVTGIDNQLQVKAG